MDNIFDEQYPNVAWWCQGQGWIELGRDEVSTSMIRVLDIEGLLWEGDGRYETVDEALSEADEFIEQWRIEHEHTPQ
ncbi:hypothetical protein [Salinibacter ruber]|uniref:Uncharacterized protein n=1 Tax=Salinibacter ruber TaxID=146919 RepID=A0A9X2Q5T9_9BACT|nr:hypothetical protein [Salinibacter ruber]MCS3662047.1 hypothetical protein [Salinibacter ruber]MCS3711841.1 hypothetical protein [Salinibacter ruber]MCS4181887.1 hypothetical protein [Salinibacter ruber]